MKNKIIGIFVMTLLIVSIVSLTGCIQPSEELDQYSVDDLFLFDGLVMDGYDVAQSFIPLFNRLSRVELKIEKAGDPGYINVSIKKNLYDVDLASYTMHSGQFPPGTDWLNFDFQDIKVTPGETYYLICSTNSGLWVDYYKWRGSDQNPYLRGNGWMFNILTGMWDDRTNTDYCFKTFGYDGIGKFEYENHHLTKLLEKYPQISQLLRNLLDT